MADIKKEFETFGEVLNFHKTDILIELKMKLNEETKKSDLDLLCSELIEPIFPVLITFDIQGRFFKCSYTNT